MVESLETSKFIECAPILLSMGIKIALVYNMADRRR